LAAPLADGKATKTYTVARLMPRLPTRLEEPSHKSPTTWLCLDLDLGLAPGRQVHTSTKRAPTTMTLHRNTAPTAMGHTEVNSPSSEMCKRDETRESRGRQHFLNNKATRALPQTFSLHFTRLHRHLQEFITFGRDGSIFISPYIWHVWIQRSLIP
jgi:hypothetical protein